MYIIIASSPSTVLWAFHTIQPSSLQIQNTLKADLVYEFEKTPMYR